MSRGPRPAGLPFELRMACRYLATRRREGPVALVTFLCMGGVLTGVMALVLTLALTDGLHGDIRGRLLASNPHVVVRSGWAGRPYDQAAAAEVTRAALGVPGVLAAAPFTSEWGLLRSDVVRSGMPVQLRGVDPAAENRVTGLAAQATALGWARLVEDAALADAAASGSPEDEEAPLSDADLAPPEPPVLLLGEELARSLAVVPGDVVRLVASGEELGLTATGPMLRSRAFVVAGLVKTGFPDYDATWAIGDLRRLAAGEPLVGGVALAVADPLKAPEVAAALRARLGDDHDVMEWTTLFGRLFSAFRWERLLMAIAIGLIGLVAGFNIFTILTLNVTARVADIGILAALGASPGSITRIFLWMGLLLGGAGTAGGLAVGAALAWVLDRHRVIALDATVYFADHVPFRVEPWDLAVVGGGMLLVSFVATVVPARAAARLDPVVALRNA